MLSKNRGLHIARSILLLITFTTVCASVVLLIVQFALGIREKSGYTPFKGGPDEEMPF